RIAQLIVEFPALKETPETIENDFKTVWRNMKFQQKNETPYLKIFYQWIKRISLSGNYRDLEKIAILWHQGRLMNFETEELIFEWIKTQLKTYHGNNKIPNDITFNFRKGVSKKVIEKEFRNALYQWSKENFQNNKEAEKSLEISRLDILKT
ncbi:MAG: hypothetical protein U9N85_09265, partial [Bacteroidota bacterium]|nr:hypothetical protein [Bacteroidota bacterium]